MGRDTAEVLRGPTGPERVGLVVADCENGRVIGLGDGLAARGGSLTTTTLPGSQMNVSAATWNLTMLARTT